MRFVGRGHPAIRATHDKTLEITTAADVGERATCVVAVGASGPDCAVAGPIALTVRAGGMTAELTAVGNPGWRPGGPAIIRRSAHRAESTFATDADGSSASLPRDLVAALTDLDQEVTVDVRPLQGPPTVVLAALDPAAGITATLAAEIAAADRVVAEDPVAAAALGVAVVRGPVEVTGRVLVVAADTLPGRVVADRAERTIVDTVGLAPPLAAALSLPGDGPIVLAELLTQALPSAPAGARVVGRVAADRVEELWPVIGDRPLVAVAAGCAPVVLRPGARLDGRAPVAVAVLVPAETGLDPSVAAAVRALLDDGVTTRTAAKALAELTGRPHRWAYDTVLELRSGGPASG